CAHTAGRHARVMQAASPARAAFARESPLPYCPHRSPKKPSKGHYEPGARDELDVLTTDYAGDTPGHQHRQAIDEHGERDGDNDIRSACFPLVHVHPMFARFRASRSAITPPVPAAPTNAPTARTRNTLVTGLPLAAAG